MNPEETLERIATALEGIDRNLDRIADSLETITKTCVVINAGEENEEHAIQFWKAGED